MARSARTSVPYEDEELRKRGYYVGALLGEGSYAKVRYTFFATRGIFRSKTVTKRHFRRRWGAYNAPQRGCKCLLVILFATTHS